MASKRFDVVATVTEERDGEEKRRYVRCGVAFDGPKGMSIKLDSVPVGMGWNGWLSLYEPREKEDKPAKPALSTDGGDDIPF
jgi:hypothetical protein